MSNIFVVDDDVDLAELIQTKLSSDGHQVTVTHSGEGAFELAKRVKPQVVVLDVMLPGVTGYQICRRIRKDPELYRAGILILTALGEEPEMMHGIEQGADDYLAKPFKLDTLAEKLHQLDELISSLDKRHPLTNLPGTEAIKREINFRLARGTAIAAAYIDLTGYKAYCSAYGQEGQKRALEFVSKLLTQLKHNLGIYESFIAHLGGEHFVVLMNIDDYERYCTMLLRTFDRSLYELYSERENSQGYIIAQDKRGQEKKCPLMRLSIGVAHTQYRQFKNAKKMFEVLAQTRQMAQPDKESVMFVDRRRADR